VLLWNRRDKPVSAPGNCLDETRGTHRIVQNLTQAADGRIQSYVEVDDRAIVPKLAAQFLAGNDISRPLDQCDENLDGLLTQAQRNSMLR